MKLILLLINITIPMFIFAENIRFDLPVYKATVLDILDGDTIQVILDTPSLLPQNTNGATNFVRFLFIDAPESEDNPRLVRGVLKRRKTGDYTKQADIKELGRQSKQALKNILKPGDSVELQFLDKSYRDRYNRLLSIIFKDNININYEQVITGNAWCYFLGEGKTPSVKFYRKKFKNAEETARQQNKGIWKHPL